MPGEGIPENRDLCLVVDNQSFPVMTGRAVSSRIARGPKRRVILPGVDKGKRELEKKNTLENSQTLPKCLGLS